MYIYYILYIIYYILSLKWNASGFQSCEDIAERHHQPRQQKRIGWTCFGASNVTCCIIASLAQGCSPIAIMLGYTCWDFQIGVVVVLDLGVLMKCFQGGVEWGDDAQPESEDKVCTSRFWFQMFFTLDNTNSLVHILRILVISFDAGWSQALHGVGLFALVTASGFACAGSLPKTPTEAQCEMSMT